MQIAIDGPAGSGKSTIAKLVADKFSFVYLDTGAMYRAAAWLKLNHKLSDESLHSVLKDAIFEFSNNGKALTLGYYYNAKPHLIDITQEIRTPEVTNLVSTVAADPMIRKILTGKQQDIAKTTDVIMDGRDIGTVVLPNADLKYFLTASPEMRAKRRVKEWQEKNIAYDYQKTLEDIIKRDNEDATRSTAPLKKADDAKEIDTTDLTIDQVTAIIGFAVVEAKANHQ